MMLMTLGSKNIKVLNNSNKITHTGLSVRDCAHLDAVHIALLERTDDKSIAKVNRPTTALRASATKTCAETQ